ncbi:MAG: GNAT family N-acetyltransferase [Solirubrobacteraceae bacterium]
MTPELTVADHPEAGRYEITAEGERVGLLTYQLAPGVITFLHAEVDPASEGNGFGSRLVSGALDDARARGLSVRPLCPFVVAYIENHPDYRDLLAA